MLGIHTPSPELRAVLDDPACHAYLKMVLSLAMSRDPVDCINDLEYAGELLKKEFGVK